MKYLIIINIITLHITHKSIDTFYVMSQYYSVSIEKYVEKHSFFILGKDIGYVK